MRTEGDVGVGRLTLGFAGRQRAVTPPALRQSAVGVLKGSVKPMALSSGLHPKGAMGLPSGG